MMASARSSTWTRYGDGFVSLSDTKDHSMRRGSGSQTWGFSALPFPRLSRLVERFVMQTQKVIGSESEGGVGPAAVIAEFHLENFRTENLDNGTHLSADQPRFGHVANQSDHGKKFEIGHLSSFLQYITARQLRKAVIHPDD